MVCLHRLLFHVCVCQYVCSLFFWRLFNALTRETIAKFSSCLSFFLQIFGILSSIGNHCYSKGRTSHFINTNWMRIYVNHLFIRFSQWMTMEKFPSLLFHTLDHIIQNNRFYMHKDNEVERGREGERRKLFHKFNAKVSIIILVWIVEDFELMAYLWIPCVASVPWIDVEPANCRLHLSREFYSNLP